jgi:hypothetical protein
MAGGPTIPGPHLTDPSSRTRPDANAPKSPNPSPDSSINRSAWLVEAAEQLQAFSAYFLRDLHLNQVQLDELYAVFSAVRDGSVSEAEALERLSWSPHWVWTGIDPKSTLLLSVQVGERTLAMAQAVLHQLAQLLAPGCVPLFLSDGYLNYLTAIVMHFGCWVQPPRRQARGLALKPRGMLRPELLYAQVVKTMRRRRIVEVKHRVVFGTKATGDQVLAACGLPRLGDRCKRGRHERLPSAGAYVDPARDDKHCFPPRGAGCSTLSLFGCCSAPDRWASHRMWSGAPPACHRTVTAV